jgi:alanine racemase
MQDLGGGSTNVAEHAIPSRLLRPSWVEIDLDAPAGTYAPCVDSSGPIGRIFAVPKADGYGFGAREMAEVFAAAGADAWRLPISRTRSGLASAASPADPRFPEPAPDAAPAVIAHGLIPVLRISTKRAPTPRRLARRSVFVKVDAGLQRLGVVAEHAVKTIRDHRAAEHPAGRRVHTSTRRPGPTRIRRMAIWPVRISPR